VYEGDKWNSGVRTLVVVRGAAGILALVVRKAIESSNQPSFESSTRNIRN
jgi:hypothetical protein